MTVVLVELELPIQPGQQTNI